MVAEKINDKLDNNTDGLGKLFDDLESNEDVRKLNDLISSLSTRVLDNNGRFPDGERRPDGTMFPPCLEGKEKGYFHSVDCGDFRIYCREDGFMAIDSGHKCSVITWDPQKGIDSGSDYKMTVYEAKGDRVPQTSEDYETKELHDISPDKVLKLIGYCDIRLSEEERRRQEQQDQSKITELTNSL